MMAGMRPCAWSAAAAALALTLALVLVQSSSDEPGRGEYGAPPRAGRAPRVEEPAASPRSASPERRPAPAGAPDRPAPPVVTAAVRVLTAAHLGNGAAPAGDVAIVLRALRRARSATDEAPPELLELVAARTGPAGGTRVELAIPAAWLSPGAQGAEPEVFVWGTARSPGWQELAREVALAPPPAETELGLVARRGHTLRGRVAGADGGPAAGVRVGLLEPRDGGWASAHDDDTTDGEGRFAIHHAGAGPRALQALAPGRGSAFRDDLTFAEDAVRAGGEPADEVALVLCGSGTLAGVVVDPAGAPAPGHRLWALPAGRAEPDLNDAERIALTRGEGTIDGRATSDAAGQFRMTGLRPGAYDVWGYDAAERTYALRTAAPVGTGSADLRIVAARHALVVRVLDHRGQPIAPRVIGDYAFDVGAADERPALACVRADSEGRPDTEWIRRDVSHAVEADGAVVLELVPGVPYLVGVVSARHPLQEARVLLPPERFVERLDVRLPPPEPPGTLELAILRPDGTPHADAANVRVRSILSGATLSSTGNRFTGSAFTATLPAGRYQVAVDADPPRGQHGGFLEPTPFAPVELEVVLRAGEVTARDVRLGASGRLRVLVRLPAGPLEPAPGEAEDEEDPWIRGASLVLLPAGGGAPVRVEFDASRLPSWFHDVSTHKAPDGVEVTSMSPIPPGRYVARLTAPGCTPVERAIEIRAGEVARLAAELERR
jgi:hypothetical protein